MPSEETILDGPATPAHRWIWNAARNAVLGSPQSPEHDNKENVHPAALQPKLLQVSSNATVSPLKRKRDSEPIVSPTKSILRTPGVPTPRAKSLRDINVKFKSLSPELRLKERQKPLADAQKILANGKTRTKDQRLEMREDSKKTEEILTATESASTAGRDFTVKSNSIPSINEEDFQNYCRRTEKETKKLLRQNQKMRDYSRQADAENMKLRKLLEEAQRDNRRLSASLVATQTRLDNALSENRQLRTSKTNAHEQDNVEAEQETDHPKKMPKRAPTRSSPPPGQPQHDRKPAQTSQHSNSTTTKTQMPPPLPPSRQQVPAAKPPSTSQQPQPTSTSPLTNLAFRLEGGPPPPSTIQRTNLPPDRVHAIRQRLASKAEARKASATSMFGESQIDWVAMGR